MEDIKKDKVVELMYAPTVVKNGIVEVPLHKYRQMIGRSIGILEDGDEDLYMIIKRRLSLMSSSINSNEKLIRKLPDIALMVEYCELVMVEEDQKPFNVSDGMRSVKELKPQ